MLDAVTRLAAVSTVAGHLVAPAHAQDELFAAMANLVSQYPASEAPRGEWKDSSLVDQFVTPSGTESHVFSPGADPCVLVHLWTSQETGKWAQVSTITYDFRKLTAARLLAPNDDRAKAASRAEDDPEADELLLEGTRWSVQRSVHIDPTKPSYGEYQGDNWSIFVLNAADRSAAAKALRIVREKCFPPS